MTIWSLYFAEKEYNTHKGIIEQQLSPWWVVSSPDECPWGGRGPLSLRPPGPHPPLGHSSGDKTTHHGLNCLDMAHTTQTFTSDLDSTFNHTYLVLTICMDPTAHLLVHSLVYSSIVLLESLLVFDWLTDWLGDWLTDWLTDWLVGWLVGRDRCPSNSGGILGLCLSICLLEGGATSFRRYLLFPSHMIL